MELRDIPRVLIKHLPGIVVITLLVFGASAAYTFSQPKVYLASSQMFISVSARVPTGAPSQTSVTGATPYVLQRLSSYVAIASSPLVLEPIGSELGFSVSSGQISADNPPGTVLINVSATSEDPVQAAQIANAASQQLTVVIEELESQFVGSAVSVVVNPTVTQPAVPPSAPISPRTRVNLFLGALVGLVLGIGYAFLRNYLDNTVKTAQQLQEITGASSLGAVMMDPNAKEKPLITMDRRSVRAEAFRMVRTNLRYVDVDRRPRLITVTSALPGEGKSTTAINLAITFGQAGQRVCLVEGDLRRPNIGTYMGIDMEFGLTDVLADDVSLESTLISWNRGLVAVLPSGQSPPNPSELLGSHMMKDVLERLRGLFDVVLIDAPPLLPVTDAAILANASDGAILIARWGKTTREQLSSAVHAIESADARILGTVMNFVPVNRRRYGRTTGYGYAYSGGYAAEGGLRPPGEARAERAGVPEASDKPESEATRLD